jgi:hypothetical protein
MEETAMANFSEELFELAESCQKAVMAISEAAIEEKLDGLALAGLKLNAAYLKAMGSVERETNRLVTR